MVYSDHSCIILIPFENVELITVIIIFSGPYLPHPLVDHSMVTLELGQAVLGGINEYHVIQRKIYHITCSHQICLTTTLSRELSIPRTYFVAIPISDRTSGCNSDSKQKIL